MGTLYSGAGYLWIINAPDIKIKYYKSVEVYASHVILQACSE